LKKNFLILMQIFLDSIWELRRQLLAYQRLVVCRSAVAMLVLSEATIKKLIHW
jgi:hypothetical protein